MITVLAQQGPVQLHLDTSNSARTIRVSSPKPLEVFAITLTPEDLPGIALKLLRSVPTTPFNGRLEDAKQCLAAYLKEQEAKQEEAKLQARRQAILGHLNTSGDSFAYEDADTMLQGAVDWLAELTEKLEAQK